ncbi:hypothetical protein ACTHO0_22990 [Cytobacillus praedii]|uniref:hypothetical protein n=1 Tax=Cytobacillus praedii TaxID=1742358 RepID=UPI003F7D2300
MPTNTTNFNLIKPGQDDFYDVSVPNANMDTIDGVIKTLQDAINSGATEQELAQIHQDLATHSADKANPHEVTKSQVGLGNVDNVKQIPITEKGQPNGVAALDANGKVINSDGTITGGGQSGIFTDTTTSIAPNSTYTKRISLTAKANGGRIFAIRGTTSSLAMIGATFTTNKADARGYRKSASATAGTTIGYPNTEANFRGILGYQDINTLGDNIILSNLWIDTTANELVMEFYNLSNTSAYTMRIHHLPNDYQSGLFWEVY